MTTYRNIHGRAIQPLATNPTEPVAEGQIWYNTTNDTFKSVLAAEAFSSSAPLATTREGAGAFGTQTTAIICGGETPSVSGATEEYNGTGFSAGGTMNTARYRLQGTAGTATAGIVFGGVEPSVSNKTETYNGTAWTTSPYTLNTARWCAGAGTQTSALAFGGGPGYKNESEEFDGEGWTATPTLNTSRNSLSGAGANAEDCLAFGGETSSPPAVATNATESWNGSSWTAVNNLNTARYGGYGAGTKSAAILIGGLVGPSTLQSATETWDGTNWTTSPVSLATARSRLSVAGSSTAAIAMAGQTPSITTATEEYNASINVITAAAWASGGALNQARRIQGNVGGKDAGLSFGGFTSSPEYLNVSEEYDGTSWTEGNNLNTARYGLRGFGIQTAAVAIGGQAQPAPTAIANYESYDGSSWTASGSMNVAREEPGGFGILTAGVATGGFNGDPATMLTSTEEYNGSSWTSGGATSIASQSMGASGTQTAGSIAGGYLGPPGARTNRTEEYGGTSWTSGPNVFINVSNQAPAKNGTQDAWQFAGGRAPGIISTTCVYDGSSWATGPNIATARTEFDGGGTSSGAGAHLICGGQPGSSSAGVTTTEEFTAKTTALNVKTLTQS